MNQESDLPSSAKKRRFELASLQLTWSGSLLNSLVHACRLAALDASLTASSSKRSKQDSSRPPKRPSLRHTDTDAGLSGPPSTAVSQEAAYQALPQELLLGPLAKALQLSEAQGQGSLVDSILAEAVRTNPKADSRTNVSLRVQDRNLMLDNPTASLSGAKAAAKQFTRSKQLVTKREQHQLGLYQLTAEHHKYQLFLPLHQLWKQYISGLLSRGRNLADLLLGADYHGAMLQVVKSRQPCHTGAEGIVIKDAAKTFTIIDDSNKVHRILKAGTDFRLLGGWDKDITLHGTGFSQERVLT